MNENGKRRGKARLPVIVISICMCALIAAAAILTRSYSQRAQEPEQEAVTETPPPLPTATPSPTPSSTPSPSPSPTATPEPRFDFDALREEYGNDDIIGYLRIDGTSVDYPVLQSGLDDPHYYLTHDISGVESVAGWIYLHPLNSIDDSDPDPNTVIYGHNMKKDIMFHSLRYYRNEDYFNEHKYIIFDTANSMGVWEIFAFYQTHISFNYINVEFDSEEEFYELALQMKEKSMYDTGVEILPGDRVLTLSTCTGISDDTRYVVNARLITDEDELPEVYKN